jgi:hypothetical protein
MDIRKTADLSALRCQQLSDLPGARAAIRRLATFEIGQHSVDAAVVAGGVGQPEFGEDVGNVGGNGLR